MRVLKKLILGLGLLSLAVSGFGQEAPAADGSKQFGMNMGVGTEIIDGKVYQTLSMVPDVGINPVGVGLDITLRFQFYKEGDPEQKMGFYIREADWWDPSKTVQQNLDMYLARIVYLRYGKKGEPLYAKFGMIQDGTLGNGFIMAGYDNSVLRPQKKYIGLAFDLDGGLFNFPFVGMETFVGNITAFDVIGARLYVRPLVATSLPILSALQIGGTFVTDRNAFYNAPTTMTGYLSSPEAVQVIGADMRLPLLSSDLFSASLFSDIAVQKSSMGSMVGIGGKLLGIFTYGAQARFLGANFIPSYFDKGYDLNRTAKYKTYTGGSTIPALTNWFATMGANIGTTVVFFTSVEGPIGTVTGANANDPNVWPKLRSLLKIEDSLLPVSLYAFYNKDLIKDLRSLIDPSNAQIGAKISYKAGPAVISMVYDLRYIPQDQQTSGGPAWEVTSKLETAVKLF